MPLAKGSRYENVPVLEGSDPPVLAPRPIDPAFPVLEHAVASADRHDRMAHHYFTDDRRFWRIADANAQAMNAGDLFVPQREAEGEIVQGGTEGAVILIPRARENGR